MIIGGCNAINKTGAGGSPTGYRENFLQCVAYGANNIGSERVANFICSARIQDESNNWLDIDDITDFSINNSDDGSSTASLSCRNLQKWGRLNGTNAGILTPSNRFIEIRSTVTVGADTSTITLFSGVITGNRELVGRQAESINLNAESRNKRYSVDGIIYLSMLDDYQKKTRMKAFLDNSIRFGETNPLLIFAKDIKSPRAQISFNTIAWLARLVFSGTSTNSFLSGLQVQQSRTYSTDDPVFLEINDDSALNLNVSMPPARFNTYQVAAYNSETELFVFSEYSDSADVAIRGKIIAPQRQFSLDQTIGEMLGIAEQKVKEQLYGEATATIRFNPFAIVGMNAKFSSVRLGITSAKGLFSSVNHRYQYGSAWTDLKLRISEVS